jgi:hypothetical protein
MRIFVDLPAEGPQITGKVQDEYETGDNLALNCTSSKSFPPARLSWYINDVPVRTHPTQPTSFLLYSILSPLFYKNTTHAPALPYRTLQLLKNCFPIHHHHHHHECPIIS